ncbi:MobC family plasmid mobilization relaxosome protein [Streptomyces sp. PSKA54]|uniref:MobC family plasmid mobilization relaxosome protein n=1 Tax=Streptomyces himalayensis subsp. aureolus TaxID=2758039 RepID=A0A7W2HHK0_9ACTN|nr:MobC family plasmid mobilization relaxosome protein [Streptomyces himalayensis]MBA4864046.1 MobC family plasmid mobilization relaxosome protein [Streptomyces himalayensis subsp. aureolus]
MTSTTPPQLTNYLAPDPPTATGRASYPVRHSYGATNGAVPAQECEDGPVGLRTRAPEDPPAGRHQGAPTSEEKAQPAADVPIARQPRRRTRAPKPRHRTQFLTVRVNDDEHAEITSAARVRAVTTAHFLATAGLAAARGTTNLEPNEQRDAAVDELAALRAQLARVGNNLNQLARSANSGAIPHPDELTRTLAWLRRVVHRIDQAADTLVTRRPA